MIAKLLYYIKYGIYRPLNIIETIYAIILNLFLDKNSKLNSFHFIRYKSPPASTIFYNSLGRSIIIIFNFITIILFNKMFLRGFDVSRKSTNEKKGNDNAPWPPININNVNSDINPKFLDRINKFYSYSINKKEDSDLDFWKENRKLFKDFFFDKNNKIIPENLKNFKNNPVNFSSLLLRSDNLENLERRKNKLKALTLFDLYHKISNLVDKDIAINLTDQLIGNPKFIKYRGQIINERILRQAYFFSQIRKNTNLDESEKNIFCDIGTGHGSLPYVLKGYFSNSKFILIDLPELNILSFFFLQSVFPNSKICLGSEIDENTKIDKNFLENYDFVILDQTDILKIDNKLIDCVINTASLGEMSPKDQNFYIENIERITNKYFYSVNRFRHDNVLFAMTTSYYDFKLSSGMWKKRIYNFSPTLHIEVLLEKEKK